MEELITAASQVGFPILISLLLLVRFEKKIDKLTDSINKLSDKVDQVEVLENYRRKGYGNAK